jgi:hypothetical protein
LPGPFAQKGTKEEAKRAQDRILHVTAFSNPMHEQDKLHDLYESLAEARHEVGMDPVPFHKFADLVKNQVKKLNEDGDAEVAFRVAIKDGKVSLTARAMRESASEAKAQDFEPRPQRSALCEPDLGDVAGPAWTVNDLELDRHALFSDRKPSP